MRRAILTASLAPIAAVACGYGLARKMSSYFTNLPDVADRIAVETNEYIDALIAAGELGSPDVVPSASSSIPNEGSTAS